MLRVRVPLQTGATSLVELRTVLVGLAVGLVALFVAGSSPGYVVSVQLVFMVFVGYVAVVARRGVRRRASDAIFEAQGLSFDGGPLHGQFFGWEDVDAELTTMDVAGREAGADDGETLQRLTLVLRHGASYVLAESLDTAEQASLRVIMEALATSARRAQSPASAGGDAEPADAVAPAEGEILACPSCGAPTAPEDAAEVPCGSCGGRVPVPVTFRERVQLHAELATTRAASRRGVARLLAQPGAHAVNLVLACAVVPLSLAPFLIALGAHFVGLALLPLGFAVYGVARGLVLDRRALRSIVLRFGARPPRHAGQPPCCHACGAPLRAQADDAVVACVYCDAENIVGALLDRRVAAVRANATDLERDLHAQARDKRDERRLIACAFVAGVAIFLGKHARDRLLTDTEGRSFVMSCGLRRASAESCTIERPGFEAYKLAGSRRLLVCQSVFDGWAKTWQWPSEYCRAVACDSSTPCPRGAALGNYTCAGGVCEDAEQTLKREDDVALCLRGNGPPGVSRSDDPLADARVQSCRR